MICASVQADGMLLKLLECCALVRAPAHQPGWRA
jgi:hypothetical protein